MDQPRAITYISSMRSSPGKVTFKQLGGWRGIARNPGLFLHTLLGGLHIGSDAIGNNFYQTRRPGTGKPRRWVVYAGVPEASCIGPEWHSWLHYTTAEPLPATPHRAWQKPHLPNLTGTAASYRPPGHDYMGGKRAAAAADYESWSPEP